MAITALSNTTLSASIDARQTKFTVGSTTGITGLGSTVTAQSAIVIDDELMLVTNIPTSGVVEVIRAAGSKAKPHLQGALVYYGAKTQFGSTEDGSIGLVGDSGVTPSANGTRSNNSIGSLPTYRLPLGATKSYGGNVYMLVDFTGTVYAEQPVEISGLYQAQAVGTTGRGMLGVAVEDATSDQWGWVQVFGNAYVMLGMSGVSPSDAAAGPTTLSTSAATFFKLGTSLTSPNGIGWSAGINKTTGYYIQGMRVASDWTPADTSATTSAANHTGGRCKVFLNFPQIAYQDLTSA